MSPARSETEVRAYEAFLAERSFQLARMTALAAGGSYLVNGVMVVFAPHIMPGLSFAFMMVPASLMFAGYFVLPRRPFVAMTGVTATAWIITHVINEHARGQPGSQLEMGIAIQAIISFLIVAVVAHPPRWRWGLVVPGALLDVVHTGLFFPRRTLVLLVVAYGAGLVASLATQRFLRLGFANHQLATRNRGLFAAVPDILLELDDALAVSKLNGPALAFFGASALGRPLRLCIGDGFNLEQELRRAGDALVRVERWGETAQGERRLLAWSWAVRRDARQRTTGYVGSARDLTDERLREQARERLTSELERANTELARLSVSDALTGVANYRALREELQAEQHRVRRYGHGAAFLLLDVDHFKHFNDTNGHEAGNVLLKQLAAVVSRASAPTDLVARYGGEEFCVLMPGATVEAATARAELIARLVRETPFACRERQPGGRLTVSIGVTALGRIDSTPEEVIRRADAALYVAKREGRDQVRVTAAPAAPIQSEHRLN